MGQSEKIGFLHIPKTGGANIINCCDSDLDSKFLNFFHYVPLVENISSNKAIQDNLQKLDWNNAMAFGGHFSLNIKQYLPKTYRYKFVTIIRNPVIRCISYIKQISRTSTKIKNFLCSSCAGYSNEFWHNTKNLNDLLMNHEEHNLNNYMVKTLAGMDLSLKEICIDEQIYNIAIKNLSTMYYVGLFEKYNETLLNLSKILGFTYKNTNPPLIKEHSNIPKTVFDFIENNNQYDIRLYEEFVKFY